MSSIPLPALAVQAPQQPSLFDLLGRTQQFRAQQQQIQAGQLENQQRQQQIKDTQAMTAAMQSWDGKDWDELPGLILKHGGSANAVFSTKQQIIAQKEKLSQIAKDDAETGKNQLANMATRNDMLLGKLQNVTDGPSLLKAAQDAVNEKLLDPEHFQQAQQIAQLPPDQFAHTLTVFEKSLMGQKTQYDQAIKERETATAELNARTTATRLQAEMPGGPLANVERTELSDFLRKNPGKTPSDYPAAKAAQEAAATQPYKIEVARAEAVAKQAIEGMVKPVYAIDKQTGGKTLMSQTDAQKQGLLTVPVTEKQLSDDTMLINRLGDVRQKIARYEQALQQNISDKDRGNMAAALSHSGFKVGAFGTEIPMDRLNAALQKENLEGMSPEAQNQMIAYKNAMEAMVGYQRVLSGSGRSSDQAMQLNIGTLPDPSSSSKAFSGESLKQFKENLSVVGQGLPKIPGIKSPEEIEAQVRNSAPASVRVGQQVTIKGKSLTVTAVHPDGSFDAK